MNERKALTGGDWLAIGVFLAGTLGAVLMSMALFKDASSAEGTGRIAAALSGTLGTLPILLLGAGVAFLGARKFLTGYDVGMTRHMLGMTGVAAGLAMILGSFSERGGGGFGSATGGRIALATHGALGAFLGVLVAFAFAWLAWMRGAQPAAATNASARRATSAPPKGDDGVSAAESQALFPAIPDVSAPKPLAVPPARPLYPEDVRKWGEIPVGAKPIAAPASEPTAPAVYRWTAPRTAPTAASATSSVGTPIVEDVDEPAALQARLDIEDQTPELIEPLDAPPRPLWERTGLGAEDEPVDAYGTPLSLVEKVRREREEPEVAAEPRNARIPAEIGSLDTAVDVEEVETSNLDEDPNIAAAVVAETPALVLEAAAVEAPVTAQLEMPATGDDLEDLEEEEINGDVIAGELELELEDGEVRADEADEIAESEGYEINAPVALEDDEELSVPEAAESEDDDAVDADTPFAFESAEVAGTPTGAGSNAAASAPIGDDSKATARARVEAPGLFDAVEAAATASSATVERDVILQPHAAVPPQRAEKTRGRTDEPHTKLLAEVGCLFVDRGRVAVSMLQRQYEMEFDDACKVLDELQEMGLIGPYLGGQRRDILLTRDQWLEKVSSS